MAEAIVLGAGTAGLAAAAMLQGAGVDTVVLERTDQIGASWRTRYDGLRLNTTGGLTKRTRHEEAEDLAVGTRA